MEPAASARPPYTYEEGAMRSMVEGPAQKWLKDRRGRTLS